MTKGFRGNKSFVERRVGESFQWKANGSCSKGTSCSFRHTRASGNRCESQGESGDAGSSRLAPKYRETGTVFNGQKNNHPLLRRKRRQRLTCRVRTVKGRFLRKRSEFFCKFLAKCKIPSRSYWHPPVCHTHTSQSGCKCGEKCQFRHNSAEETPSKKSKKGSAKGSVALLKKVQIVVVYLKIPIRRSLFYRKLEKWDRTRQQDTP